MSFEDEVVEPVRRRLGRPVRLPSVGSWTVETERGAPVLRLELDVDCLTHNVQTNRAAAPFFLLCFAYWFGRARGIDPTLRVDVVGAPPASGSRRRHLHRAAIALEGLEEALGDRLVISGLPPRTWPARPVFNAPKRDRDEADGTGGGREHRVEVALTRDDAAAEGFSRAFAPITGFRRQLPLGLFDGEVSNAARWTPGNGAQADLWSTSPDGAVFHLFELKVGGNAHVGVLPELLVYSRLLHRARVGLPDGTPIDGGGPGIAAARAAERIQAWIVAPSVHPLVEHEGRGPLEWLDAGLRPALRFRSVAYAEGDDGFEAWIAG